MGISGYLKSLGDHFIIYEAGYESFMRTAARSRGRISRAPVPVVSSASSSFLPGLSSELVYMPVVVHKASTAGLHVLSPGSHDFRSRPRIQAPLQVRAGRRRHSRASSALLPGMPTRRTSSLAPSHSADTQVVGPWDDFEGDPSSGAPASGRLTRPTLRWLGPETSPEGAPSHHKLLPPASHSADTPVVGP